MMQLFVFTCVYLKHNGDVLSKITLPFVLVGVIKGTPVRQQ
jgi:hypothetical protein